MSSQTQFKNPQIHERFMRAQFLAGQGLVPVPATQVLAADPYNQVRAYPYATYGGALVPPGPYGAEHYATPPTAGRGFQALAVALRADEALSSRLDELDALDRLIEQRVEERIARRDRNNVVPSEGRKSRAELADADLARAAAGTATMIGAEESKTYKR